jgi:peptidoglycan/xylan/chitin deacetylase (PgdA/CDA1 family)
MLVRMTAAVGSARDPSGGVAILAYHATPADPGHPAWIDFRGHMSLLEELNYDVVSLATAVSRIRDGAPADRPSVAITFDDGWANNLDVAFPELARRGWPGTVFVTTSFLGKRPFLDEDEVRSLGALGIDVEPHTDAHPDLTTVAEARILEDLSRCRARIEDLTGRPTHWFCYPFGRVDARVRDVVSRSGLSGACTGRSGRNRPGTDPFLLRRVTPDIGDGPSDLKAGLAGGLERIQEFRAFLRGRQNRRNP